MGAADGVGRERDLPSLGLGFRVMGIATVSSIARKIHEVVAKAAYFLFYEQFICMRDIIVLNNFRIILWVFACKLDKLQYAAFPKRHYVVLISRLTSTARRIRKGHRSSHQRQNLHNLHQVAL